MKAAQKRIKEAIGILNALGLPSGQQNERTAICLLALLDLTPGKGWGDAAAPRLGIRGILDFAREKYAKPYAENTRETVRDESIKPLVAALALMHNPDDPARPVNSPKNC
ncbi:MAG TPA: hypothetical protein VFF77_09335, partial [Holophagaceae bacterium]|nr:hypothetical protein [Holophagaceae bacterium]